MPTTAASAAIDELIHDFFAIFDNRQHTPDLQRLQGFFIPGAIITKFEQGKYQCMSLDEFIRPRQVLFESGELVGFHEWEERWENVIQPGIATRFTWYRKEGVYQSKPFQGQGRKSIQLLLSPDGWRIVSILWEDD